MPARRAPEDFVTRVTRRIAELRQTKGITQEELAALLDVAPRNVQRIEAGQNLTLRSVARIAEALGVTPEELVGGARAKGARSEGRDTGAAAGKRTR